MACGSTLNFDGPDQGCLNCLARFALSPEGDETDGAEDFAPSRTFGHFEIVSDAAGWPVKLGRGAMGITYRARDTVLHTEVALKIIGLNVAGHPAARAAFLSEARAAAKLRHANVASVFHYGEQDGQCFYAMELVEGETLEARLRRDGPLPPALVLEVGRQVACALMEAEALGIVHRDLKPSNIMLAHRRGDGANDPPHVKVIDFGLAQAVDLAEAEDVGNTAAGGFIGTPSFASPEQFASDAAHPADTRSDIYSLGVTLWYLLSGKLPFSGSTLSGLHGQQVERVLPLDQLRAAHIPTSIGTLLQRMLKANPDERPPSARALVDDLVRCQMQISRGRSSALRTTWLSLGLIALLGGLAFAFSISKDLFNNHLKRPTPPVGSKRLAVLAFENLNPGEQPAYFPAGVQEDIASDLARIAAFKVVSSGKVESDPAKARDYAAIGRELGVDYLLTGGVRRADGKVNVQVQLIDVHAPGAPWREQVERPLARLFDADAQIVRNVAGRLNVALTAEEEQAIAKPPTTNPEAYDLYLQSQTGPQTLKGPAEMREHLRREIALLEKVIALDPDFVLAYCSLARAHDSFAQARMGSTPEELAVDHRTLAEVALQRARQLDPDGGEVHHACADHFIVGSRDNTQARIEAELAVRKLPNNGNIHTTLGTIALREGRWDDALAELQTASDLQPLNTYNFTFLTDIFRITRRYAQADLAFARLIAIEPADVAVEDRLSRSMCAFEERGDLQPLRAALAAVELGDDPEAEIRNLFGLMEALCSRDADAVSRLTKAAAQSRFGMRGYDFPKSWFDALAARLRGDADGARAAFAEARKAVEQTVQGNASDTRALSLLAMIDAGLGRKEEATKEAQRACEMASPSKSAAAALEMACNLAVVYAWTDQTDLAFSSLEKLVDQAAARNLWYRPTYGDLKLSPIWDPLRGDPRFTPLVQRLAPHSTR